MRWTRISKTEWHPWFAWRPVVVDGLNIYTRRHWVWLEKVERKKRMYWSPVYRTIGSTWNMD